MAKTPPNPPQLQTRSRSDVNRENALRRWGGWRRIRLDDPGMAPGTRDAILTLYEADLARRTGDNGGDAA